MILISHRGNIEGSKPEKENDPRYVEDAISFGFDVEIDLWVVDNEIYLGHNEPKYKVNLEWLNDRVDKLWVHCKSVDSLSWISKTELHYFWHENDTLTLTSKNFLWTYPGKQPILNSISVMPEINNDDITKCLGVCSDFISNYK